MAIGSEHQAEAFDRAMKDAEESNALGAKAHLVQAGRDLRLGNWPGSVRESIHAVEAMAKRIAPEEKTLGAALKVIEKKGHLHGSLKSSMNALYGYANDENGIRHALLDDQAKVDETDAVFMLGACAAFVSYLVAREAELSS